MTGKLSVQQLCGKHHQGLLRAKEENRRQKSSIDASIAICEQARQARA